MAPEKEERPATAEDVEHILTELERLPVKQDVEVLRAELTKIHTALASLQGQAPAPLDPSIPKPVPGPPPEQLVTLDQMGAMVHRSKRSLERYRKQMPPPRIHGRRGRPHLWVWSEIRPWLEATFGLPLKEHFPHHSF